MKHGLLWFVAAAIAASGCVAESEDTVGTVGVPLTTSGPDGSTYRLTPGTRLSMWGGTFYDEPSLDGDSNFVRISVPVGDYEVSLVHDLGYTTEWPLIRTEPDGTSETVLGVLVTPMPAAMTIGEGTLTNLVLTFQVADAGTITFAQGDVGVILDVDEVASGSSRTTFNGLWDAYFVTTDATFPPALIPELPAQGATGLPMAIIARQTGPWYQTSTTGVCAPVIVDGFSADPPGLVALLSESFSTTARLCAFDDGSGAYSVSFTTTRLGTAQSALFQSATADQLHFRTFMQLQLPGTIFDGTTLDPHPMIGTHSVDAFASTRVLHLDPATSGFVVWYRAFYSGTGVQFSFEPLP